MRNLLVVAASIAALAGTPAVAGVNLNQPSAGYTYFHKAGETIEAHDAQIRECKKSGYFGQPSAADSSTAASQGLAGVIAAVIVNAAFAAMQADNIELTSLENCMVVHGWDVVRVPDAEGEPMSKLEPEALHEALAPMVGAEAPQGEVIRAFDNDLAKADTVAFLGVGKIDKPSFSRTALPRVTVEDKPKVEKVAAVKPPKMPKTAKKLPAVQLLEKLQPVPEGSALLLMKFEGEWGFPTLNFRRVGPDEDTPAWVDGQPANFHMTMLVTAWAGKPKAPDGVVAISVPAGRWILDSITAGVIPDSALGVHLCYGAPAFEAAAGEVVYLGSVSMQGLAPDMTLDPARLALASRPELAEKLRAASYTNGDKGSCGGLGYGYALEVADAPFVDGYALGSRAKLAMTTLAGVETSEAVETVPVEADSEVAVDADAPPAEVEAAPAEAVEVTEPTPVADPEVTPGSAEETPA